MLEEAEDNAQQGKHQYLSGLLHNVAKIMAHDSPPTNALEALKEYGFGPGADLLTAPIPWRLPHLSLLLFMQERSGQQVGRQHSVPLHSWSSSDCEAHIMCVHLV